MNEKEEGIRMNFTKMHGCGNDYVYINGFEEHVENKSDLAIRLSDRHFGIGGDGVIFINPSANADFEMEMYNADGSRAEMCGNGIRCVAKYVFDKGLTDKTSLCIESCGEVKHIELMLEDGKVSMVKVNMGSPVLRANRIPILSEKEEVIQEEIEVDGMVFHMTAVSMGNPHVVMFVDDVENMDLEKIGPLFEHHPLFPNRVNAEFVKVIDRKNVKMRVWERGSGETLACGTGCCATAVACILNGLTEEQVTVKLLGGSLTIQWDREQNLIFMTGPATTVFEGVIDLRERRISCLK